MVPSFEEFYRKHYPMVLAYVMRRTRGDEDVAQDVAQETFAAAMELLPMLMRAEQPIESWLIRQAKKSLSKAWARNTLQLDEGRVASKDPTPEVAALLVESPGPSREELEEDYATARVEELTDTLTHDQRQITALQLQGMSAAEISLRMQLSRGAVGSALHRIKKRIRFRSYRDTRLMVLHFVDKVHTHEGPYARPRCTRELAPFNPDQHNAQGWDKINCEACLKSRDCPHCGQRLPVSSIVNPQPSTTRRSS